MLKPDFRILVRNQGDKVSRNVTDIYKERLLSLEIQDSDGVDNDSLVMTFDNAPPYLPLPPKGAVYTIYLGYEENMRFMGSYTLNKYSIRGDRSSGHTLQIECNSRDVYKRIAEPRTRIWENTSLTDIIADLATNSGYSTNISSKYSDIIIPYEAQINTTDQGKIKQLAERYDATMKVKANTLNFLEKGEITKILGQETSKVIVTGEDVLSYSVTVSPTNSYNKVKVKYKGNDKDYQVTMGQATNEGRVAQITTVFDSQEKAEEAGKSFLIDQIRAGNEIELDLVGNPYIESSTRVVLRDTFSMIDGEYIIKDVRQSLSKQDGFKTHCATEQKESDKKDGGALSGIDNLVDTEWEAGIDIPNFDDSSGGDTLSAF